MKVVSLFFLVPDCPCRDDDRISFQRECRNSSCCTRQFSKKRYKHTLEFLRVQVRQNPERPTFTQHSQSLPCSAFLVDCLIPESSSYCLNHLLNPRVVDGSHQEADRVFQCRPAKT